MATHTPAKTNERAKALAQALANIDIGFFRFQEIGPGIEGDGVSFGSAILGLYGDERHTVFDPDICDFGVRVGQGVCDVARLDTGVVVWQIEGIVFYIFIKIRDFRSCDGN